MIEFPILKTDDILDSLVSDLPIEKCKKLEEKNRAVVRLKFGAQVRIKKLHLYVKFKLSNSNCSLAKILPNH